MDEKKSERLLYLELFHERWFTQGNICPICKDVIPFIDLRYSLPCLHPFHNYCYTQLKKFNDKCPLCRCQLYH